jgi:hypothetical protein
VNFATPFTLHPQPSLQWYDDDGSPVGGGRGCRQENSGCNYVHPSSDRWSSATRRKTAIVRGRGGGFGAAPSSRDNGWNNRRQNTNSEWDKEAWKPKTFAEPAVPSASPVSSSNEPQASTSKVTGAAWATDSDSGSKAGNGGWGSAAAGWGETASTDTGGWGDAGWGSGAGWGTGSWGDNAGSGKAASPTASTAQAIDPPISTSPAHRTRPKDLAIETDDMMAVDTPVAPPSASSYRAGSHAPSEPVCATPQSAFPPFAVPAFASVKNMTRSEIHAGILKCVKTLYGWFTTHYSLGTQFGRHE